MIQFDEHIFQMGWNHQPVLVFNEKQGYFQQIYICMQNALQMP